ncbi:MAG: 16S rRNA (cytosine(1402)-N(4))-methyltransferase RsmH [Bacteroidetes bacterium]|nr:16S rRNA (cytosine(1402)-N(4))-methyltransferase RsmH [Bacteroidota bacterium]
MSYHSPVLLAECLHFLNLRPNGTYVDATFGGGGHSRAILEQLGPNGRLIAFDQDPDAQANALSDSRYTLVPHNFEHLKRFLKLHRVAQVDGILADLGVSSHQLDVPERGFAHKFDGPLDMRMNPEAGQPASEWLNEVGELELRKVLAEFGDVERPAAVAAAIVRALPIATTTQLKAVLEPFSQRGRNAKLPARVFQAIRIAVNREMDVLDCFLTDCVDVLAPGGRLVVMSYHSLEDRRVKNLMREGRLDGEADRDDFGRRLVPFSLITRKPVSASPDELERNPRSRSARLRAAEKTAPNHG